MIIIKVLNLFLIILISFYIGNIKAKTYENRVIELNKFQNALGVFKTKIEFTYEPIKNIFYDISNIIYLNNKNIFQDTIDNKNDIYVSWTKAVDESDFNKEDKEIIKMFGKLLGKTDLKGQVSEILQTQNLIEKQIKKAELEKEKNVKLYKTMGIVCGIGICIILV